MQTVLDCCVPDGQKVLAWCDCLGYASLSSGPYKVQVMQFAQCLFETYARIEPRPALLERAHSLKDWDAMWIRSSPTKAPRLAHTDIDQHAVWARAKERPEDLLEFDLIGSDRWTQIGHVQDTIELARQNFAHLNA